MSEVEEVGKIPFLIISPNQFLRGIVKFILETLLHADVTELESEEKALMYLKNLNIFPGMIIYDYTPNAYLLEDFVIYLQENIKNVKIVVLSEDITVEGKEQLKSISQLKLMEKSGLPSNLVEEAKKVFLDSQNDCYENKSEYCSIELRFLSILDGVNKNLFIKLGKSKFVKLFNEDDNTETVDFQKYQNKGVNNFFITRETALWVIDQIQRQINLFLRSNNFRFILRGANDTPEKRFEQKIIRINDEVHIDAEFKAMIDESVDRIRKIVEKEKNVMRLLENMKTNSDIYAFYFQKRSAMCLIACLLAKQLEWNSRMTIDKLIFAAIICDITLSMRPKLLKITNLSEFEKEKHNFTMEDQKRFLRHPKEGAELIKHYFPSAPPETDSLAYQHEEMPDGSGYPDGMKGERISPLSALFIVSNHFTNYYLLDEDPSIDAYLLKAQVKFDYANFRKVLKALECLKKQVS